MKLPVWPEEDQKDVLDSLTDYNSAQKFDSTSSDDKVEDEKNINM